MAKIERCPTGINGFDPLIGGGFPRSRSILLSGACGTGKTAFGVEFIHNGVIKHNEAGIFVALEQNPRLLRVDMLGMGYDLGKVEKDGRLRIIDGSLSRRGPDAILQSKASKDFPTVALPEKFKIDDVTKKILEIARQINAKRVVVDSISSIDEILCSDSEVRNTVLDMHYALQDADLTSILILDTLSDDGSIVSKQGVEEYVADGVVVLKANEALNTRTVRIKKLRGTKHTLKPNIFELTSNGIKVGQ